MRPAPATIGRLNEELRVLLAPHLGTFENNRPALWTDAGDVPSSATGVQCVVDYTYSTQRSYSYGTATGLDAYWIVTVKTFDRSKAGMTRFRAALDAIRGTYRYTERVSPPSVETLPQVMFYLYFSASIHCTG
jgi:hypothetical protein